MSKGEIIIYSDDTGAAALQVRMVEDSVWLTQLQMAELFGRDKSVISRHIRNAIDEGEVEVSATVANFATVQNEGERKVSRNLDHYNLDLITANRYKIISRR